MLLAVIAAGLVATRTSTSRSMLDGALVTNASSKAALLEDDLDRTDALALLTARVPPFSELYAGSGSLASAIAAVAGPHREIDNALRYVWRIDPSSFVEAGYVDIHGHEDARVVDGRLTPLSRLLKDVRGWPAFAQGASTPVGVARISQPFLSPAANVPVVASTTTVSVGGRVRAYVEVELAMSALSRALASDVNLHRYGLSVVDGQGHVLLHVGRAVPVPGGHIVSAGLMNAGGSREAVHALTGSMTQPWFVIAGAAAPSTFGAVGPLEIATLAVALLLLILAIYGWRRIRSAAAQELSTEQRARAEAERRSRVDPLTGLFNRRHAMETIDHELARALREGGPVGILMLDLDHFKRVNDDFGHAAGDAALIEIGRRLLDGVRVFDTVARIGGEEFCVVIPGVDDEREVAELGERLRRAIAERTVTLRADVARPMTASVGAALVRTGDGSAEYALDCADRALYAAKRRGRNRVCLFSELDYDDSRAREPECIRMAEALAVAQSMREHMPTGHTREVAELSGAVAARLGLTEDEVLRARLGGWLHDVGKVSIPDAILSKPAPLSEVEWESIRSHPTVGEELIRHLPELAPAAPAVRGHHERWDGSGYPDGLAGERIPIEARIVAAVDAYSAMTSERPFRRAREFENAIGELRQVAGSQLDPSVVDALVAELAERRDATLAAAERDGLK